MIKIIGLSVIALVVGSGAAFVANSVEAARAGSPGLLPLPANASNAATLDSSGKKTWTAPPEMKIDPAKSYVATIDTTEGAIVLDLFAKDAPKTVNNFAFLAKEGFYDGLIFHRVIPDFMIQGGDPTGSGSGGPGYQFEDEVGPDKPKFKVGSLAMANAGPATNGSQFFITDAATSHLNGHHTIFGQVREGQDVVKKITAVDRDEQDRPRKEVKINSIKVDEAKGDVPSTEPAK